MFDQIYGVGSDQVGDVYLKYGTALFELSREESGVLDGVVNTQLKEEEEAEDDEEEEEGEGDDEGNNEENPEEGDQQEDGEEEPQEEEEKQNGHVNGNGNGVGSSSAGTSHETPAGTSNGEVVESTEAGSQEQDAEPTNAEIAWEVLTLARDVFLKSKDVNPDSKTKLADALQTMGEISLEWENFEAARDLFEESLSLKKEVLAHDDRSIAESYYHIGIAYSFLKEIERANDCFRCAISVLESRIVSLKETGDAMKEAEWKELEKLLPDLAAKIEDSRDQMNTSVEVEKLVEDEESRDEEVANKVHNSPVKKPINDISHLVKRKRPVEEEVVPENGKRQATDKEPEDVGQV